MLQNLIRIAPTHSLLRQIAPILSISLDCRRLVASKAENSAQDVATKNAVQTESTKSARNHINPFAEGVCVANEEHEEEQHPESDEDRQRRLKVLKLEVDMANQEGRRVPPLDYFQQQHWDHILTLPTRSARLKYYAFQWQIAMKKEARQRKKEERAEASVAKRAELRIEREQNDHIIYGLGHTSLFLRIYDTTINHWQNNRLTRAMQFSPKIVLDCSYDVYMTNREASNAAKQLMLCFAENRSHDDPFDMHYCNVNMKSVCMKNLQRYIPTMLNSEFPMNVHKQCFTEIFPKNSLVYLTPHCRTDLVEYNPDDVYIIGAMVDTVNNDPLSLAKAKRLGLRMARLPLDQYLQWGSGSGKSLTLNQVLNIMLDQKCTGDWEKSLSHVPRRKVVDLNDERYAHKRHVKLDKRANRVNVRIDNIFNHDSREEKPQSWNRDVRTRKDGLQFNLETWGSKKKRESF